MFRGSTGLFPEPQGAIPSRPALRTTAPQFGGLVTNPVRADIMDRTTATGGPHGAFLMSAGAETNFHTQEAAGAGRQDAALLGAAGRLLTAYASLPGVMYGLKDGSDGRYLAASESLAQFYGRPLDEVLGRNDTELLDPTLGAAMRAADQTALAHGRQLASEHRFDWRDTKHDWEVLRLVTELGGRRVLACLWRDLGPQRLRETQLHAAIEQIEQHQIATQQLRREFGEQLMRDSATGLATRAHFEDQLRREVDLSTREHREFAMVLLELDDDSQRVAALGSRAHDQVLEAMGRLLRGNTRAMDASCRLQGRRFAVLLSGVGLATAHSRMEGLRRQCATQIVVLDGEELGFSVSIGVASFPHTAHSQNDLMSACESALGEARRRGGNTVALASIRFDPA
jgi:diguanylate cyclase (GGDEF)-like protein